MPSVDELQNVATELNATLTEGVNTLDNYQVVTFTKYVRRVLPLDGYVFWVNSALINPDGQPTTVPVNGYIHLTTNTIQEEEALYDKNAVIFTGLSKIDDFNEVDGDTLYIGNFFGVDFAFSQRTGLNDPANLYHYFGHAIYPEMESQIINTADDLDLSRAIVSSSLPIWLSLTASGVALYPAMLSESNLPPPYATVRCSKVIGIAGGYYLDVNSNQYQLVQEEVKINFTGLRNDDIQNFWRFVNEYTLRDDALMGIMNIPVVQDERVPQNELNVIAMRKTITFQVNYYQGLMRDVARKLILKAIPNYLVSEK
ncbi:hypothetical protein PQD17_gp11 [Pantoea phage PdC23]|uniref:Uncharacterized protein n=1 Tax=Pantoea phage PdC23 TaxID=2894356 RepID=A0AAE9C8A8_9CAUD|nr:hypothetical protein PQD17_gp11 [Pantoea phage PdC23]UGC97724.1 hypothetical protein pdc_011 [Pantoea phage PdC23]